jgi:hypothetical protein
VIDGVIRTKAQLGKDVLGLTCSAVGKVESSLGSSPLLDAPSKCESCQS